MLLVHRTGGISQPVDADFAQVLVCVCKLNCQGAKVLLLIVSAQPQRHLQPQPLFEPHNSGAALPLPSDEVCPCYSAPHTSDMGLCHARCVIGLLVST